MSNNPILPIIPGGAGIVGGDENEEKDLQTNNPNLDDGESNDERETVDEDVREATAVNDKLEE